MAWFMYDSSSADGDINDEEPPHIELANVEYFNGKPSEEVHKSSNAAILSTPMIVEKQSATEPLPTPCPSIPPVVNMALKFLFLNEAL